MMAMMVGVDDGRLAACDVATHNGWCWIRGYVFVRVALAVLGLVNGIFVVSDVL